MSAPWTSTRLEKILLPVLLLLAVLPLRRVVEGRNPKHDRDCTPCEGLFSKLETLADGKRVQNSQIQVRGEPKTGTTLMYSWARGILDGTCEYLRNTYGSNSCRVETYLTPFNASLIFEPRSVGGEMGCSCDAVDRVIISIQNYGRHLLPVPKTCRWWHRNGVPRHEEGCLTVGGRPIENYSDLMSCMREAPCDVSDNRVQFAPMRDPRAVAVSTYYHVRNYHKLNADHYAQTHTLDETVVFSLPRVCQWTAVRYFLFAELMADRSEIFWYEDAVTNPYEWHLRWARMSGLTLPKLWMEGISRQAGKGSGAVKKNVHVGGKKVSKNRNWKDEVSPEILDEMDDILRTWLPSEVLGRFGVLPKRREAVR